MRTRILLLVIISAFFTKIYSQNMTPAQIIKQSKEKRRYQHIKTTTVIKTTDKDGHEKTSKVLIYSQLFDNGKTEKRRIEILDPSDMKGTIIFVFDYSDKPDEKYVYMPAIKQARKIAGNNMSKSFVGTVFTGADMTLPSTNNYILKLFSDTIINGNKCYSIYCFPKDKKITSQTNYSKQILYINKNNFIVERGKFFDKKGILRKTMEVKHIKKVEKTKPVYMAVTIEIKDLRTDKKSVMNIQDIQLDTKFDNNLFSPELLNRE
jgi:hypothetical protein